MAPAQKQLLIGLSALVFLAGLYAFTYGEWSIFSKEATIIPQNISPALPSQNTPADFSSLFLQSLPSLSKTDFMTYIQSFAPGPAFTCDYKDADMRIQLYVDHDRIRADTRAQSKTGYSASLLLTDTLYLWFPNDPKGYILASKDQEMVYGMVKEEIEKRKGAFEKTCKVQEAIAGSVFEKPARVSFQEGM